MAPTNSPMKYLIASPPSMPPVIQMPTVTAGLRCAPLNWPTTYTATMTAMPHPKVITIHPEFCALEWFNSTAATTPSPRRIRIAVPIISAPMMLNETPLSNGNYQGPRRDPGGDPIRGASRKSTHGSRPSRAGVASCAVGQATRRRARPRRGGGRRPVPAAAGRPRPGLWRRRRARLAGADRGDGPVVGGRRGGARRGGGAVVVAALLGVEPRLHARHRLVAVLAVLRADRRSEADRDRVAAEDHPGGQAPGPGAPGRHRLARAGHVDRHDRHVVGGREDGGARVQLAPRAVARARALGVQQQVPALAQEAVQVVRGALVHAPAATRDRHGAEQERHGGRDPALAVEVVGRGGDRGPLAPGAGQRAQDRRRVHVARVVGDEDHGRAHAGEDLAALDPALDVPGHRRREEARQDRLAREPRRGAARPRHVERGAPDLAPSLAGAACGLPNALLRGVARALMGGPLLRHGPYYPVFTSGLPGLCAHGRQVLAPARHAVV